MPSASNSRMLTAIHWIRRCALIALFACQAAFTPTAQASRCGITMEALDPITQHHLRVALAMLNSNVLDIRALETLLAGEMEVASTIGMNVSHASTDSVRNEVLRWIQTLQPADTLVVALEQGSNTTVYWALRQIIWRNGNGRFDAPTLARLQPGVRAALTSPQTATRVQAVETMIHCLPLEEWTAFLQSLLRDRDQPDEVVAEAIQRLSGLPRARNAAADEDADANIIVRKWLKESKDPKHLFAACLYTQSRGNWRPSLVIKGAEEEEEDVIAAYQWLATHPDPAVRSQVPWPIQEFATPARPRLVQLLLRLTHDTNSEVARNATRSLRNATAPEVTTRLRELSANPNPELRWPAVEVLGYFGKNQVPLLVTAATTDKNAQVRQFAIYSLRKIGTPAAGRGLEAAASRDPDRQVREEAATQLDWFRKEHPVKP